jgi:hypothetical protein
MINNTNPIFMKHVYSALFIRSAHLVLTVSSLSRSFSLTVFYRPFTCFFLLFVYFSTTGVLLFPTCVTRQHCAGKNEMNRKQIPTLKTFSTSCYFHFRVKHFLICGNFTLLFALYLIPETKYCPIWPSFIVVGYILRCKCPLSGWAATRWKAKVTHGST